MGWTWQSRWRDEDLQLTSLIPWPECPVGPQGMPPGVRIQLVEVVLGGVVCVVTRDEGGNKEATKLETRLEIRSEAERDERLQLTCLLPQPGRK